MIGKNIIAWLDRIFYPHYEDRWDDFLFRKEVERSIDPMYHLLDLGAGRGNNPYINFRGKVSKVMGLDTDPSVLENPFIDEAKVGKGESIPYGDAKFNIVIAANTLEHLNDPEIVFQEVSRVLKPWGSFIIKTPNKYHYVPVIARLTPISFHCFYNRLRGIEEKDVFPTKYKANDPNRLQHLAQGAGLEVISIDLYEGRPEYLRLVWPTYLCGLLYERLVNRFKQLRIFRGVVIAKFRKPQINNHFNTLKSETNNSKMHTFPFEKGLRKTID